ncbi:MAG: hypothetical protein HRU15_05175 [Planctomycetes bacterium]|nr:hypothetical protein [Planctomycetota bacterium]
MQLVQWIGDMNWPQTIEQAEVIDCSQLESLGVWAYDWLRAHPQIALVAASDSIKQELTAASLPVLWYNHCEEISQDTGGVSSSERDMLWS